MIKKIIQNWLGFPTVDYLLFEELKKRHYTNLNYKEIAIISQDNLDKVLKQYNAINNKCNALINANKNLTKMYRSLEEQLEEIRKYD